MHLLRIIHPTLGQILPLEALLYVEKCWNRKVNLDSYLDPEVQQDEHQSK